MTPVGVAKECHCESQRLNKFFSNIKDASAASNATFDSFKAIYKGKMPILFKSKFELQIKVHLYKFVTFQVGISCCSLWIKWRSYMEGHKKECDLLRKICFGFLIKFIGQTAIIFTM